MKISQDTTLENPCLPAGRRAGMNYYVYAIKSTFKNYIYVGLTQDLERRLLRHNNGREKTTKPYKPYNLIHVEISSDRNEARKLEKYFKSGYGKEILSELADVAKLVDAQA